MRTLLLSLALTALVCSSAQAHGVHVFAYVDGSDVVVRCSYSKSRRVDRGTIEVKDAASGQTYLTGETDDSGHFRFPVPEAARAAGNGLRILLRDKRGHRNDWVITAAELTSATAAAAAASDTAAKTEGRDSSTAPSGVTPSGLTRAEVAAVVNAALDAKLAPLRRALVEQTEGGPGVREIVGGIGWILGLVGVAAYFKSRPRV